MDGFQTRLRYSLQFRISLSVSLLVSLVALIAGAMSFRMTYNEAHDMQDTQLQQIAYLVNPHNPLLQEDTGADMDFPERTSRLPLPRVIIQNLSSPNINLIFGDDQAQHELARFPDGLQDFSTDFRDWRVYIRTFDNNTRLVVAQRAAFRNRIAIDSAWSTVLPLLFLIPMLWLLITVLVHSMFRTIARLKTDLDNRHEQDLEPLSIDQVPLEIRPFVLAINRLFIRVQGAIEHDKQFIGNAAHELRTPMTALGLQLSRLQHIDHPAERDRLTGQIRKSLQRTQQLLEQLLAMARAQNTVRNERPPASSLLTVLRQVTEDLLPLVEARRIDFGVLVEQDYLIVIEPLDLRTLLKNLIENAVRYTPEGGQVDVRCHIVADSAELQVWVEDTGQGIPAAEREQVFEPFYRILGHQEPGSGLGLAIVKTLCDKWQFGIEMGDSAIAWEHPHTGLAIALCIPAVAWAAV